MNTGKCPCCGSRHFVSHQSRRICAYCRSEQDGQPVQAERSVMVSEDCGITWGYQVVRPEVAVRIGSVSDQISNELSRLGLVSLT